MPHLNAPYGGAMLTGAPGLEGRRDLTALELAEEEMNDLHDELHEYLKDKSGSELFDEYTDYIGNNDDPTQINLQLCLHFKKLNDKHGANLFEDCKTAYQSWKQLKM